MIIDGVRVSEDGQTRNTPYIAAFLSFIERRLGVKIVRDLRTIPYGRLDLSHALELAHLFKQRGIITSFERSTSLPDEPRFSRWRARCNNAPEHPVSGATAEDESGALLATLGEALERYLWTEARDHFVSPVRGSVREMKNRAFIAPERFAGYSDTTRAKHPDLTLTPDASYLWVQGYSHISHAPIYVPAQTVSGARDIRASAGTQEPIIRQQITTGVATWPTKDRARLSGALEVIERDAYMITWLNQITPKRIRLDVYRTEQTSLARLIARCEKYRLRVHALRLVTDAPTHATCVVLEDMSGVAPRFAFGLKAHCSISKTIEGAIIEALRARRAHRTFVTSGAVWDTNTNVSGIGHTDRIHYWAQPANAARLEFLLEGSVEDPAVEPWTHDTDAEHLARIIAWCKTNGYEFTSVSLGTSSLNPTSWHTELVLIPELQPTHLSEQWQQVEGPRVHLVPELMGYTARHKPFIDAPHPFA